MSPHYLTALAYKEESAALHLQADDLRKLKDGYVFFDYMSIPQEDREAQGRAIALLTWGPQSRFEPDSQSSERERTTCKKNLLC